MMYIIYNHDGSIKEKNLNEIVIQGSNNVNKIAVNIQGVDATSYAVFGVCKLPNGEKITTLPSTQVETIDGVDYVVLSLTEDMTALEGLLRINIQAIRLSDDKIITTYTVYLLVNEGVDPGEIVMMSVQQYQTLVNLIEKSVQNDETILTFETKPSAENYDDGQVIYVKSESTFYIRSTTWQKVFDFTDYYTKSQTDILLDSKANTTDVNAALELKADKNGPLPKIIFNGTQAAQNLFDLLVSLSLSSKIFCFSYDQERYIACFHLLTGENHKYLSFEIEKFHGTFDLSEGKLRMVGHNVLADNLTLQSLMNSDTYRADYEVVNNKVTSLSGSLTNDQYPSAKCVYDNEKALSDRITNMENLGRFLSLWNANTGEAVTNPPESPYEYKTGDYFRVSTSGNRIVNGSSYVIGGTNYTTSQVTLGIGDVLHYDGTNWQLQLSGAGGNVVDVQVNGTSVVTAGIANVIIPQLYRHNIEMHGSIYISPSESWSFQCALTILSSNNTLINTKDLLCSFLADNSSWENERPYPCVGYAYGGVLPDESFEARFAAGIVGTRVDNTNYLQLQFYPSNYANMTDFLKIKIQSNDIFTISDIVTQIF